MWHNIHQSLPVFSFLYHYKILAGRNKSNFFYCSIFKTIYSHYTNFFLFIIKIICYLIYLKKNFLYMIYYLKKIDKLAKIVVIDFFNTIILKEF